MPYKKEEDDDLFEDDFEFVDDDDDDDDDEEDEEDSEIEEEAAPAKPKRGARKTPARAEPAAPAKGRGKPAPKGRSKPPAEKPAPAPAVYEDEDGIAEDDIPEPNVAAEPEGPPADHVVHIYEFRKFKRTIARDFTSEDADKFAVEYNRTSSNHSRWAVSGNKDDQPTPKI